MIRIFRSVIVILWSTILYLSLRKANYQKKISVQSQNLLMFWPAMIVFLIIWIVNHNEFFVDAQYICYIAISSFFFSFLWKNYFSRFLSKALPILAIASWFQKAMLFLLRFSRYFYFNSHLLWSDIIAICSIIIFSGFLLIDRQKDKEMEWYRRIINAVYAFLALWLLHM